ncbi:MAG TPA: PEP-CTERM sorting domain-containing protein [Phycisphaerae bacterium]|nr:PEP-CTERM sorting domain-containing protein [Phycisphaerae bacterium]HNU44897.1 PEP-CTERM sorting domain-containing protein [Phycisphaerae bacterium]
MRSYVSPHLRPVGVALIAALLLTPGAARASLFGIERDTGRLYHISVDNAALDLIGETGLSNVGALEYHPGEGVFYALTMGVSSISSLYRIRLAEDRGIDSVEQVGLLGIYCYEGGLAFAPDGTAYALNGGSTLARLMTINLETGQATVVNPMEAHHDINGLGWRADGMLIGLDATTQTIRVINPATAASTALRTVTITPGVGTYGGMAVPPEGATGYFVTGGPGAPNAGSNALYSFNVNTGEYLLIGSFPTSNGQHVIAGEGFSGLAFVPEPATLLLLVAATPLVLRRRRR